jgi:putative transposase
MSLMVEVCDFDPVINEYIIHQKLLNLQLIKEQIYNMHGHKISNQHSTYYITMTIVGWIDVFTRDDYRKIVIESLAFCQKEKGLVINAYVIMSNHIHLICYAWEPYRLSDILRDFKKFTSKEIISAIENNGKESRKEWMLNLFKYYAKYNKNNKEYQFWQHGNKPIELASSEWIDQKLGYIHLNPVRNGMVMKAEDYQYSSAGAYCGLKACLEIEQIHLDQADGYVYSIRFCS